MKNEKKSIIFKECETDLENNKFAYTVYTLVHHDEGGYIENKIIMTAYKDGAVSLMEDDGEDWVYIYPEMVEFVKQFFDMIKQ